MVPETTLHFFCGKMAAGKSTLAIELAKDNKAILLIEDDWLSHLYPEEITDIQEYIRYSVRLKNILSGHVVSLLPMGCPLYLISLQTQKTNAIGSAPFMNEQTLHTPFILSM